MIPINLQPGSSLYFPHQRTLRCLFSFRLTWPAGYLAACIPFLCLLAGCFRGEDGNGYAPARQDMSYTRYASGFAVEAYRGFDLVHVFDPWQNSRQIIYSYILGEDPAQVPDSLRGLPFITVPVQRVITFSTTHLAFVEALGESEKIRGISGAELIYDPRMNERIRDGAVIDVGHDQALNYERIIALKPDVFFLYGVEDRIREISNRLTRMGIPVVFCGDYLEDHPLGRAEWIRFFALFFQKESEAMIRFQKIDSAYRALAELTADLENKPLVLTGLPWKDTWYMAGGNSFAARLIEDAGGTFLWNDTESSQAIPLDLEAVFSRAVRADVWINPGTADSLEDLVRSDGRFSALEVVRLGNVFNHNARTSHSGGNDYWESGIVSPHLVLADLIKIFHPGLMEDHHFIYYRKLK
ncbi:MAG TPA: ABC transporter substrate-binding protein [Bacteroides sp.]|nr:ABC transporter substrate-binding protein [Bacteroides sp.]